MKKLLSMLLCAVFLLGTVPAFSVSATNVDHIDVSSIDDGGKYTDAKGNEYTVLKSADTIIATVKANMSGNYILGNDIDFNGNEFARQIFQHDTASFSGIFDGNGYSITNFKVVSSINSVVSLIFGKISGNAKVLNLTVGSEDAKIQLSTTKSPSTIGGLVGKTEAGAKATIQNVHVYADISYDTAYTESVYIGGIIGDSAPINILDSSFHGSIKFTNGAAVSGKVTFVGGIVGRCNAEGVMNIINCKNYAELDATVRTDPNNNAKPSMGGILGYSKYAFNIRNCENYGSINAENYAGGIVGCVLGMVNTTYAYDIVGCRNYGSVNGEYYVGGILGASLPSAENNSPSFSYTVSIRNCFNAASVTQSTTNESRHVNGLCSAGGIVGYMKRGYNTVENCASIGDIAGNGKKDNASSTTNGIFGFLYMNSDETRTSVIMNCYAAGEVTPGSADYMVYATGKVSMDKAKYKPFVSNCYSAITLPDGYSKLSPYPNDNIMTGNYGDYTYIEPAIVTTEVSDGTLLSKLGDGFTQTVGTDDYPIPVQPEYIFESGRENLFSNGADGYYNDTGVWVNDKNYSTKSNITVKEGDVITVGALSTDQATLGHLFDADNTSVKKLTASDMTLVADLGNGYGVYSLTIPEGVSFLSITTFARRAYITLLAVNDEFDADGYYDYFGIEPMTGNSQSPLWRKSALFIGDSICYGFSDTAVNGKLLSYGGRVAYNYDMDWVNAGVSGATLSTATEKLIVNQLPEDKNFDYVLIEGGINDALNKVAIGNVTGGLNEGLDTSTYAGALEFMFRTVTNTYPDAKIGFMITYQVPRNKSQEAYITYQDITKEICDKWDIEYLDMFSSEEINGADVLDTSNTKSPYLPDGIHPSASGYVRLCPYIASFMETLAVPVPNVNSGTSDSDTTPDSKPPVEDNSDGEEETAESDTVENTEETSAEEEKKKGCKSLIGAPVMLMSALSLGAAAITKKKKFKNK